MMAKRGSRVRAGLIGFLALLAQASGASAADPKLSDCVANQPSVPLGALGPSAVSSGVDYGNITLMALDGQYDRGLTVPRQQVARAFYATHPDQYDFLIVFTTFEFPSGIAVAFYNPVRNDVAGIGQDIFDRSADFSSTRLQGYIDMAALSRQSYVASDPRYAFALGTLSHEVMHRWGAFAHYKDAGGSDSTALLGQESAHWSYFLDSNASVMYGAQWQLQSDGKFHAVDVSHRYGPLDMYLAGFAAPSEVAPFALIRNGDGSATDFPTLGAISGGQAETITIDQVIAATGQRQPSAANAPRSFNAAMILLARPGENVAPGTLLELERFRVRFEQEFVQMTNGRAVMRVFTQPAAGAAGLPQILHGGADPAQQGAPLANAVKWLESKQQADGHWQDRAATALRDTAAATQALAELDPQFSGLPAARAWLAARTAANLDQQGWKLVGTSASADAAPLAAAQDASGGFALQPGWSASTFDTATVAAALAQRDPAAPSVRAALEWLAERQNADGSFGVGARGRGRVLATLRAASALSSSADPVFEANRIGAAGWLAQQQAPDGGIGSALRSSLADTIETFALAGRVKASPNVIVGVRTKVASVQFADGDWGGSVYLTATAALATAHDQRGNLAVSGAPSVVPAQPHDGETASLHALVTNTGNVAVPATVARWFDGDPAQGAAQLGADLAVPALNPGDTAPLALDWDTTGKSGSHHLTLVLDATALVEESSEDDNTVVLGVDVGAPSTLPTLIVNPGDFALTPSAFSTLPSAIHVGGLVHDIGLAGVSGAVVRLYASPDLTHPLAETTVDVPARGAAPIGLDFTVTTPAALHLLVRVDPDNAIAEGSESNHDVNLLLPFGQSLDLALTTNDVTLVEAAPAVGQNVDFDVTVRNLGTIDAPSAALHAEVVQGGSSTVIFDNTLQLDAGHSVTRRLTWRALAAGSAELRVTVDPANQIVETREDNNSATLDFTVADLTQADLTFVPGSLAFVPTPGLQGQPLVASLTVRNPSPVATGPFRVALYAADPRSGAPALGTANVSGMAGASEQVVTINVPDLDLAGDQTLFAWIDAANQVDEADETNNVVVAPLRVTSLPDVAVSAADIALDPALPVQGQPVHAHVTVRNLGGQEASGVLVRLLEGDASGTAVGADQTIAHLPAGASAALDWDWTLGPNARSVTVSADPDHTVREGNEANNVASLPFDVQDGTFFASQRYISPNGDGVQDETAIVFVLPLAGAAEVDVVNGASYTVRHYLDVPLNETLRGQVIWDGRDDAGRIVPDGDYHVVALDAKRQSHAGPLVTVDNNASSLLEAVHSPYGVRSVFPGTNVSGVQIPPITSPVRDQVFGFWSPAAKLGVGLNRTETAFPESIPVISGSWVQAFGKAQGIPLGFLSYAFSPDGRSVVALLYGASGGHGHDWVVTAPVDQTDAVTPLASLDTIQGVPALGFFDADTIVIGPDTSGELFTVSTRTGAVSALRNVSGVTFYVADKKVLPGGVLFTADTGVQAFAPRDAAKPMLQLASLAPLSDGAEYTYVGVVSPQQDHVAVYERNGARERIDLVDLTSGAHQTLFDVPARTALGALTNNPVSVPRYAIGWLERQDELLVQDAVTRSAVVYAENGAQLALYAAPPLSRIGQYQYTGAQGQFVSNDTQVFATVPDPRDFPTCNAYVDARVLGFEQRFYDPSVGRLRLAYGESILHEEQYEGVEMVSDVGIRDYYAFDTADGSASALQRGTLTPLVAAADLAQHPLRQTCVTSPPADYPVMILADGARLRVDRRVQTLSRGLIPQTWPEQNESLGQTWPDETRAMVGGGMFSSLLNLSAILRARTLGRGIELTGVAADRNFASYQIDWAPIDQPNAWHVLTPASSDQVFVDEFLTWVPPTPGTFLFRLTVLDKAGNRTSTTATASSFDSSAIDSFAPTPRFFSPNGDGVQDLLQVTFNVRSPVTLDLLIANAAGTAVRHATLTYDSSQLGPQHIDWDGRDDGGALLPDGRYRVNLDGFAAWVTLDSTPPDVFGKLDPAYPTLPPCSPFVHDACVWPQVVVAPAIHAAFRETNLLTAVIESAPVGSEAWSTLFDFSEAAPLPPGADPSDPAAQITNPLLLRDYDNRHFRARAVDRAGNTRTLDLGASPEQLIVQWIGQLDGAGYFFNEYFAYQPPPFTQPFDLNSNPKPNVVTVEQHADDRLRVLDASGQLVRVALELASADTPTQWTEAGNYALADIDCPSHIYCAAYEGPTELQMPLPADNLPLGSTGLLRIRGERADGSTLYSNQAPFQVGGVTPPLCVGALPGLGIFESHEYYDGVAASATLHIGDRTIPPLLLEDGRIEFYAAPHGETAYVTIVDARGYTHRSPEALLTCGTGTETDVLARRIVVRPEPVVADRCDDRPSDQLVLALAFDRHTPPPVVPDPAKPQYPGQELFTELPARVRLSYVDGYTNLPVTVFDQVVYEGDVDTLAPKLTLSTAQWPAATYQAHLEATAQFSGVTNSVDVDLPVEKTPPTVALSFPLAGQRVCAKLPSDVPSIVLRGTVDSASSLGYRVQVGAGAAPLTYALCSAVGEVNDPPSAGCSDFSALVNLNGESRHGDLATFGGSDGTLKPYNGIVSARLKAFNWSGGPVCTDATFYLDSDVEFAERKPAQSLFEISADGTQVVGIAPSGSSTFANATFFLRANERVHVLQSVVPATIGLDGTFQVQPDGVATTVAELDGVQGDLDLTWDGRLNGAVVPDGAYAVVFTATDGCSFSKAIVYGAVIDATPPNVAFTAPTPGSSTSAPVIAISGTASDAIALSNWSIDYALPSSPSNWTNLAGDQRPRIDPSVLKDWSRGSLTGQVTLRLSANDLFGNHAETLLAFTLLDPAKTIAGAELQPALFSPNGDGTIDLTRLKLDLLRAADLTIDAAGASIYHGPAAAGSTGFTWDGRNAAGQILPDGAYTVTIAAVDPTGAAQPESATLTATIDNTPPTLDVLQPSGAFAAGGGSVRFHVDDAHLTSYESSLTRSSDGAVVATRNGTQGGDVTLLALTGLPEGSYHLHVAAHDGAGNSTLRDVSFQLDSTAPVVSLTTPADGALIASASASSVSGSVNDANLAAWTLSVAPETVDTWTDLAHGSANVAAGEILSWTPHLADGRYRLRLRAVDQAGNAAEAMHRIEVDGTPPLAHIAVPANGGAIRAAVEIDGTASDAHLASYRLSVATPTQAANGQWADVFVGTTSVSNEKLAALTLALPDDTYVLRLLATDRVGLTASDQVTVRLDSQPPPAPIGLIGHVQNNRDAVLDWSAVSASDLAGYYVYRGGARITPAPVAAAHYVDANAPEGRLAYAVTAVDLAGNESAQSNVVTLLIDHTPPLVSLSHPVPGERVRGAYDIVGTAYSRDDFKQYRLTLTPLAPAGAAQTLASGTLPLQGQRLATWNTLAFADETAVRVHLETEDTSGNLAAVDADVTVDNGPPAAPTGLTAVLGGSDVQTHWNPNTESDLLGYLLYRDNVLIGATGTSLPADLRPFALADNSYLEAAVPDGTHTYVVYAIDKAGNVSPPSQPATLAPLDGHPPSMTIVQPANDTKFESSITVLATSPDTDIARVQFAWRAFGANAWTDLGTALTSAPYRVTWTPPAGSAYGTYEIRALAIDLGGRSDPVPPSVRVVYADLTPPDVPQHVLARADGGTVHVTWAASTASDLAGYRVYRDTLLLTPTLLTVPTFDDTGLNDGPYGYAVTAVDAYGNESDLSVPATAHVFSVTLDTPYSPVSDATAPLSGSSARAGTIAVHDDTAGGGVDSSAGATAADGAIVVGAQTLALGSNHLSLRVTDSDGNVSRVAEAWIDRGNVPAAPSGVAATVAGDTVTIGWNANAESDLLGYRVQRNGYTVPPDTALGETPQVTTQSACANPAAMLDGNPQTYCDGFLSPPESGSAQTMEFDWTQPRIVSNVTLAWISPDVALGNFDLDAWSGHAWVRVARVRGAAQAGNSIVLQRPYRTTQMRLTLYAAPGAYAYYQLAEVRFVERTVLGGTSLAETVIDGTYRYRVTAVSAFAFESPPSVEADAVVGNPQGTSAVVLSGSLSGNDATLNWTASDSPAVVRYELQRDGHVVANVGASDARTFVDLGLANGVHAYVVYGYDAAGNPTPASNTVAFTVSGVGPGVPTGLTVTPPPGGEMLDIAWQPGGGSAVSYYVLRRANAASGPFQQVLQLPATTYRDSGLVNGTTYWYTVEAVDAQGYASGQTAPVAGTPNDLLPPNAPLLTYPTVAEDPITLHAANTLVCGAADPFTQVSITRDGVTLGSADVAFTVSAPYFGVSNVAALRPAPDGRNLATLDYNNRLHVQRLDNGVTSYSSDRPLRLPQWAAHAATLYYVDNVSDDLYRWEVGQPPQFIGRPFVDVTAFAVSADERTLLVAANYSADGNGSVPGVWLLARNGAAPRRVGTLDPGALVSTQPLAFAPDGTHALALQADGIAQVIDVAAGTVAYPLSVDPAVNPAFSPDGARLAYARAGAQGNDDIVLFAFATQAESVLYNAPGLRALAWSPDNAQLALSASSTLGTLSLADGTLTWNAPAAWANLTWTASGRLFGYNDDGSAQYVDLEGWFCRDGVALIPGANRLGAFALDDANHRSVSAAPIEIDVPTDHLPDLAVGAGDILFLPPSGKTGQSYSALATLHNLGSADVARPSIDAVLIAPDGTQRLIAPIAAPGALAAGGGVESVTFALGTLSEPGSYTLRVTADPDQTLTEANEANNSASAVLTLSADGAPVLELNLAGSVFAPDAIVAGDVAVTNPGTPFDGSVRLSVFDGTNAKVADLGQFTLAALGYGRRFSAPLAWDAAGVFSGNYHVHAELLAQAGNTIATRDAAFAITTVRHVQLTLLPASAAQTLGATVSLHSVLDFSDGNALLSGANLTLSAIDPNGTTVWSTQQTLGTLVPGYRLARDDDWSTGALAQGVYTLRLSVTSPDLTQSTDATVTLVSAAPLAALAGTLRFDPGTTLIAGETTQLAYHVANVGATALTGVQARLRIVADPSQTPVTEQDDTFDLALGAGHDGTLALTAPPLALLGHAAILEARLPGDAAGQWRRLAQQGFAVVDLLPPQITVLTPTNDTLQPAVVPFRATIVDLHSAVATAQVRVDGGAWQALSVGADGTYARGLAGLADGPHTLTVRATDTWNNPAQTADLPFTVDATPPSVTIAGVHDLDLVNHAVAPTVTITDAHLAGSDVRLNGTPFVSGTAIDQDGSYVLSARATDAAGNQTIVAVRFTIDRTAPSVAITAPLDGATVTQGAIHVDVLSEAAAHVTLTNGNFQASTDADAQGRAGFDNVPLVAGANTLSASAVDRAGNTGGPVSITVTYQQDTTASLRASLQPDASELASGTPLGVTLQALNPNATPLPAQTLRVRVLDGAQNALAQQTATHDFSAGESWSTGFSFASTGWPLGAVSVTLELQTAGGWTALDSKPVTVVDRTPPLVALTAPGEGAVLRGPLVLQGTASDALSGIARVDGRVDGGDWSALSATGGSYQSAAIALADGDHSAELRAFDGSGNSAGAGPVHFAIDSLPPQIAIANVADGDLLNHAVAPSVSISDAHPGTSSVRLNGTPWTSGSTIAHSGDYRIDVDATDAAGNSSSATLTFTLDLDAPQIAFDAPQADAVVATATVDVAGHTEAAAKVHFVSGTFTVDTTADAGGAFTIMAVPLNAGANTLTAHATDKAGNLGPDATITVTYRTVGVSGRFGTLPGTLAIGLPLDLPYVLHNTGNSALSALPLRVELHAAGGGAALASDSFTADLAAGADGSGTRELATAGLTPGDYVALLLAQPPAGPAGTWITLDTAPTRLIVDACRRGSSDTIFADDFEGNAVAAGGDDIFCNGFEVLLSQVAKRDTARATALRALWRSATGLVPGAQALGSVLQRMVEGAPAAHWAALPLLPTRADGAPLGPWPLPQPYLVRPPSTDWPAPPEWSQRP